MDWSSRLPCWEEPGIYVDITDCTDTLKDA